MPNSNRRRRSNFRCSNIEEFRHVITTTFGATSVEVFETGAFEARGNSIELRDTALLLAAGSVSLAVDYPAFNFVRMSIPLKGNGATTVDRQTIEVNQEQTCVISLGRESRVRCDREHEWLNLRLKSAAIERRLTSLLGAKPNGVIEFDPISSLCHPHLNGLCRLVEFLAHQLHSTSVEYPPLVLQELEQALLTAFLLGTRHSFNRVLERGPAEGSPMQLRRIEAHIEAHWDQAVSIEALVEISGLSARAIFRSFQRHRGYSPMAFAKMVRLRHAREMLGASSESTTVTEVAFKCGFANHGHFARDYRDAFGQLPSETLARSRRKAI